jgi:hypothetical protein
LSGGANELLIYFSYFCNVKKIASLFLLVIMLFSQTELHQLLRIPRLIDHFAEHKEKSPDLSFMHFIKMHYGADSDGDSDGSKDQELPFKSTESAQCFSGWTFVANDIPQFTFFDCQSIVPRYLPLSHCLPRSHSGLIWQPPKFS